MATCFDYSKIAIAAYYTSTNQYDMNPPGHMVDEWAVSHWETGTLFGNGYQGGIWQNDHDVVVGCCGTNPKQKGKFFQDLLADLKIALKMIPSQARGARNMVRVAKTIAQGRRVSVTGHSLGGGLAQICAVTEGVPFVSFNAPPMRDAINAMNLPKLPGILPGSSLVNFAIRNVGGRSISNSTQNTTPGLNFRIVGDPVSDNPLGYMGEHVGTVVILDDALGKGGMMGAHGKDVCWQAIMLSDWCNINPFEAM
jgi:hypothetical protein